MRSLSDKAIVTHALGRIVTVLMVIAVSVFMLSGEAFAETAVPFGWITFAAVIIGIGATIYSVLWVKLFGFQLNESEVKIEKGVISKSYDSIPYSRIQNVGIERSLLERILGISTVDIQTAGGTHYGKAEGNIPGVDKHVAEQVREDILGQARQQGNQEGGM